MSFCTLKLPKWSITRTSLGKWCRIFSMRGSGNSSPPIASTITLPVSIGTRYCVQAFRQLRRVLDDIHLPSNRIHDVCWCVEIKCIAAMNFAKGWNCGSKVAVPNRCDNITNWFTDWKSLVDLVNSELDGFGWLDLTGRDLRILIMHLNLDRVAPGRRPCVFQVGSIGNELTVEFSVWGPSPLQ